MKKLNSALLSGATALAFTAAFSLPAFATTFLSGGVAAGSNATIGVRGDPGTIDNPQSETVATIVGNSALAVSNSTATTSAGSVYAYANTSALWNSADSGAFNVSWGWENNISGIDATAETNQVPANWYYTFVASGDGVFNLSGTVSAFGDLFGLQPLYVNGGVGLQKIGGDYIDPNGTGTVSYALLSGQTYTIEAYNFGNINSSNLNNVGSAVATVNWNITYNNVSPVPLPAALPLLAAGLGALGAATRRRRNKKA